MELYCNRYWIQLSKKLYRVIYAVNLSSNLKYKFIRVADVTFNLNDNSDKPFIKTHTIPTCNNVSSNHFTPIIKQM